MMKSGKMMRRAVYAASLDPITNGHVDVIERTAPLYDELVVVVAVDSRKNYTFTPEERVEMAKAAISHVRNARVDVCIGHYVVNHADQLGAQVVIRGLRNFNDMEDEQVLAESNRLINPKVETVWVPCRPNLAHVSSGLVKGHVGADPDWEKQVALLVPTAVVAKLKEKYILRKARGYWSALMETLGNPKASGAVFKDLLSYYSESHRAYHNLEHIVNMFDDLEQLNMPERPVVNMFDDLEQFSMTDLLVSPLRLAIWFHDVVYVTKAKDNEERSADLAREMIKKLGLPESWEEVVSRLIMMTKHDTRPTDYEAAIIVDLDLAILGKSPKEFDAYEAGIRKEYKWVSEPKFRAGRAKILQSFFSRRRIYSLEFFKNKYEKLARSNLKRSIKQLGK